GGRRDEARVGETLARGIRGGRGLTGAALDALEVARRDAPRGKQRPVSLTLARRVLRLRGRLLEGEAIVGGIDLREELAGDNAAALVRTDGDDFARHLERDVDDGLRLDDAARGGDGGARELLGGCHANRYRLLAGVGLRRARGGAPGEYPS